MSFFTAMAAGYVKEINNISKERAKQEREDELRAEEIQNQRDLVKYKVGLEQDNWTKQWGKQQAQRDLESQRGAFNSLPEELKAEFIQNADSDALKRIFGEGFDVGTVDFANLLAESGDTTRVGNVTFPFELETGKDESVFAGVDRLELYLANNPDFVEKVMSDPKTKEATTALFGTLYNNYNAFWHKEFSTTGEDGKYTTHAYRDWSKGLSRFHGVAKQLGIISDDVFKTAPIDLEQNEVFIPESGNDQSILGYRGSIEGIAEEYGTTPALYAELASYHGMGQGGGQLFMNMDYMTYGMDEDTPIARMMTDDDKMQAIALGSALLNAGAKDLFLLEGGAATAVMDETMKILTIAGGGSKELDYADEDVGAMRRAMFTIVKPDARFENQLPNHLTGISGVKFAENQKYDVKGFREQASATDESVEMLQQLVTLQEQYGATGLVAKVEAFALGVVGQAKQASELFMSNDPAYDTFNQDLAENTDGAALFQTAKKYLGEERLKQLSKMDALRLTLAAKMARAVDPSGRLSNQDFDIQLQRLGGSGWFTDQTGSLAKLETVLTEFQNRQKSNADLSAILAKDEITVEDRRFIKASNAVTRATKHRRKQQVRAETASADVPPTPPKPELIPVPDSPGYFTAPGDALTILNENGDNVTDEFIAGKE